jgi:DNA primase
VSCLDGDLAGDSGTKDINDSLQFIHSFSIAKLPAKKDINDLANEDCLDAFLAPILAAA